MILKTILTALWALGLPTGFSHDIPHATEIAGVTVADTQSTLVQPLPGAVHPFDMLPVDLEIDFDNYREGHWRHDVIDIISRSGGDTLTVYEPMLKLGAPCLRTCHNSRKVLSGGADNVYDFAIRRRDDRHFNVTVSFTHIRGPMDTAIFVPTTVRLAGEGGGQVVREGDVRLTDVSPCASVTFRDVKTVYLSRLELVRGYLALEHLTVFV